MEILCDNCRAVLVAARLIPELQRSAVTLTLVDVAEEYGVSIPIMTSRTKARPAVKARHEAMRRLGDGGFTLKEIGQVFTRHHSTVIYAMDYANNPHRRRRRA